MRGRKPIPSAMRGRPTRSEPGALPRCPDHLSPVARKEWRRLATPLHRIGVLTVADRAALAAYCQAWARWVEAEQKLAETPLLLKTPSGYVQQSPWLSIANKQLEIMGRYMGELGLTPAARCRLRTDSGQHLPAPRTTIRFVGVPDAHRDDAVVDGTSLSLVETSREADERQADMLVCWQPPQGAGETR